ncbi:FkbM family methyltransferase [Stieleria varia]|uniref:Methyltransferase FkbM domain-containing protein n=1 Tax=Stieleria varia TaxID=2528005 RepID=A0A5C6B0X5_9BACT|nr:FkbM family methyltransferase [Stieleria varia]TWU05955.1 hypothetical protein Pla52n_16710 [Stieleria varia]
MNAAAVLTSVLALLVSTAAIAISWKIWQKLREVHLRLHRSEQHRQVLEQNLGIISRATSQAIAAQLVDRPFDKIRCAAQHGEELYLWQALNYRTQGVFIEIGAYDGISLSNSLFFESIGWRSLLIEAHPELVAKCRTNRPAATVVHAALGEVDGPTLEFSMVRGPNGMDTLSFLGQAPDHEARILSRGGTIEKTTVPARTLKSVLAEHSIDAIDCMSIDVEGAELAVLKAANLGTLRPRLIVVEDNSGGSDLSVSEFLKQNGYVQSGTVGCNVMYTSLASHR